MVIERFVLKDSCTSGAFKRLTWGFDWDLVDLGRVDAGARIDVWETEDEKTEIHLVTDEPIGLRYIVLHGQRQERVIHQITENCALWSYEEAVAALRGAASRNETLTGVYTVALTAPEDEDENVLDDFRKVGQDPDPGVRQSLVTAAGYLPWRGLVELVADLHAHDPVGFVRDNAGILLEGMRLAERGELPE